MPDSDFPWFSVNEDAALSQGDIIERFPFVRPPVGMTWDNVGQPVELEVEEVDLIVLTQTCDLVPGRVKVENVVLCAVHGVDEYSEPHQLATKGGLENCRTGRMPGYHLLNRSTVAGWERDFRVVEFCSAFTVSYDVLKRWVDVNTNQISLRPPYREHLAQGFARFFMRVGLPEDIPQFK